MPVSNTTPEPKENTFSPSRQQSIEEQIRALESVRSELAKLNIFDGYIYGQVNCALTNLRMLLDRERAAGSEGHNPPIRTAGEHSTDSGSGPDLGQHA